MVCPNWAIEINFRQGTDHFSFNVFLPFQVFFEEMSNYFIWWLSLRNIPLRTFPLLILITLIPLHDIIPNIRSFGEWIDIFLVLNRINFLIPFKSFLFSPCKFVTIRWKMKAGISITKTFHRLILFLVWQWLTLHILFVSIYYVIKKVMTLAVLKSTSKRNIGFAPSISELSVPIFL